MARIGKLVETERRTLWLLGARVRGEGRMTAHGYGASFWGDENVLKEDTGDGCTTL